MNACLLSSLLKHVEGSTRHSSSYDDVETWQQVAMLYASWFMVHGHVVALMGGVAYSATG